MSALGARSSSDGRQRMSVTGGRRRDVSGKTKSADVRRRQERPDVSVRRREGASYIMVY